MVFQVNAFYEITALLGEELFINGSVMNNLTFEQNFIAQNGGDESGEFTFNGDADLPETITAL